MAVEHLDAVIVGAGLSGICAAGPLNTLNAFSLPLAPLPGISNRDVTVWLPGITVPFYKTDFKHGMK